MLKFDKCGCTDSFKQRLVECNEAEVASVRGQALASKTQQLVIQQREGEEVRNQTWRVPRSRTAETGRTSRKERGPSGFFLPGIPIFTDGSNYSDEEDGLASAGSAAIQVQSGSSVRRLKYRLDPDRPQTAVMAEHLAAKLACIHSKGARTLVTDPKSVVKSLQEGRRDACSWSRSMAGVWKDAHLDWIEVRKAKAHSTRDQAVEQEVVEDFQGNEALDLKLRKRPG